MIAKFVGEEWTEIKLRQSLASIDQMLGDENDRSQTVDIDRSNLILALQGNVYADWACNSVVGHMGKSSLVELKNSVRTKIIELTIAFERSVPEAVNIKLGPADYDLTADRSDKVTSITNHVVHGNVTTINTRGDHTSIQVDARKGDSDAVAKALVDAGVAANDADAFAAILASEPGGNASEPLGERACAWVMQNLKKATTGAWNIGVSAATSVLTEAAKRYYGF